MRLPRLPTRTAGHSPVISKRMPSAANGPRSDPALFHALGILDRTSSIPVNSQKSPTAARRSRNAVASVVFPELGAPLRITTLDVVGMGLSVSRDGASERRDVTACCAMLDLAWSR